MENSLTSEKEDDYTRKVYKWYSVD
jgi:hypothetical protein